MISDYKIGTIGRRAAREIRKVAWREDIPLVRELTRIDVDRQRLYSWEHGATDPGSAHLWNLWRHGYDVLYIISGYRGVRS